MSERREKASSVETGRRRNHPAVTDCVDMGIENAATQALEVVFDGVAGMAIVECAPPYDAAEITSLKVTQVICDVLACPVRSGNLAKRTQR